MHDGTELDEVSDLLVVGVVFEQNPAGGLGIGVVPQVDVKAGAVAVDSGDEGACGHGGTVLSTIDWY